MSSKTPRTTEHQRSVSDGVRLFFRHISPGNVRGVVIWLHGYGDYGGRYPHVFERLAQVGVATIAPDHRGHGRTANLLGYIDSLDAIVDDIFMLRQFAEEKHPGAPVFLMGHSMGGLLALLHLQRYQSGLSGCILMAPAVEVPSDIPAYMVAVAETVSRFLPTLPVQSFFDVTKSSRMTSEHAALEADPLIYKGRIRARTGAEILGGMRRAVKQLSRVTLPVLVLQGGDDFRVAPRVADRVFDGLGSIDKEKRFYPDAYHELFYDPDTEDVLAAITEWLTSRLS